MAYKKCTNRKGKKSNRYMRGADYLHLITLWNGDENNLKKIFTLGIPEKLKFSFFVFKRGDKMFVVRDRL